MATLQIRFPGGRYHATPWGHHVNEGLVEWPPSPWRLLRALLATGYTKLGWKEGELSSLAVGLFEKLAGVLPDFDLPGGLALAHSRHYMPAPVKTTLVFDTWAKVNQGVVHVRWPIELTADERDLLAALAERLSYLGRAESWTSACLVPDHATESGVLTAPCEPGEVRGSEWEQTSLLAAEHPALYTRWRTDQVQRALEACPQPKTTARKPTAKAQAKLAEQRARAEEPFPPDLVACLGIDTGWLQRQGWSQPPGSRWVLYWRRRDALEVGPPRKSRTTSPRSVQAVLLALATRTGGRGALPSLLQAFPQALRLHRALAQIARGPLHASTLQCLLGRQEDGEGARTGHGHCHILPLHLDRCDDQKIDHILLWAPDGLNGEALSIIRRLKFLDGVGASNSRGEHASYLLATAAEGSAADLAQLGEPLRDAMSRAVGRGTATDGAHWQSVTPFFAPRFVKARGKNALEGQVRAELAARGLPGLRNLRVLTREEVVSARFLHYLRRDRHRRPKVDLPLALRLELEQPIPWKSRSPICLGFGSHFGLGRFEAV